jgi:hypothetical protein
MRNTSTPRKTMEPADGDWRPAMVLSSVDLPAPLAPMTATISPDCTCMCTSLMACN